MWKFQCSIQTICRLSRKITQSSKIVQTTAECDFSDVVGFDLGKLELSKNVFEVSYSRELFSSSLGAAGAVIVEVSGKYR